MDPTSPRSDGPPPPSAAPSRGVPPHLASPPSFGPSLVPRGKPDAGGGGAAAGGAAGAGRVRAWLVLDAAGGAATLRPAKAEMQREVHARGVQLRDLRLLDPQLATSYPSALLSREAALVVNLEYIKAIITTDRAYVTNLDHEHAAPFVAELRRRLAAADAEPAAAAAAPPAREPTPAADGEPPRRGPGHGPFELRVLEACLDTICSHLGKLATELEAAALPAVDALTKAVDTLNLERERRLKNRMVRLTTRVQTLREVLEALLDDDDDMLSLHLSARAAREAARAELEARRALGRPGGASLGPGDVMDVLLPSSPGGGYSGARTPVAGAGATPGALSRSAATSVATSVEEEENEAAIEEVEQLLEAYFMQIDNTYDRLQALAEYVDDAEDFINIQLDSRRNEILKLNLVLTTVATSMATVTAATSLFAMNLKLSPDSEGQGSYWTFITISVTSAVLALCISVAVLLYSRHKRLL